MQSGLLLAYFRETILYQDTHHKQVHLIGGRSKHCFRSARSYKLSTSLNLFRQIRKVWGQAKPTLPESSDSLNGFLCLSAVFRSTHVEKILILTYLYHTPRVFSKWLPRRRMQHADVFPKVMSLPFSSHTVKESWHHISPAYCAHFPHIYGLCLCKRERETKTTHLNSIFLS